MRSGPLLPLFIATLEAPSGRGGSITGLVMMAYWPSDDGRDASGERGRSVCRETLDTPLPLPLLLGALAAGAVCCALIAFVGHWAQLLALQLLLGLLAGGALTLAYAIGGRTIPAGVRTAAFGALAGADQIGAALSPVLAGALVRWASLGAIFILDAALYAVVSVWAWTMLPAAGG